MSETSKPEAQGPKAENRETILISRYSSRRLYNTHTSNYVTLEEIAVLINEGYDIQVVDKKTGDDLTRQILLQIITEHEAKGDNVLPLNVLTDIVRSYGSKAGSFIPDFLADSFNAVKDRQKEMLGALKDKLPNPFGGQGPLEQMESWRNTQSDMLKSMIRPWMPSPGAKDRTAGQPNDDPPPEAEPKDQTTREEELSEMMDQLQELQKKLKDL